MIDIQCDHRMGWWYFSRRCKAKAVKHILHYPVWGLNPEVMLLCAPHFDHHIGVSQQVLEQAHRLGNPLQLSHLIKDAGKI